MDEKTHPFTDAFTGVEFKSRAANHYEENDGVPVAPHVDVPRPTVRARVENLLRRGEDPLRYYVGSEGVDMEIPEDGDAPLTPSEVNYLDMVASDLAERAPLPDEGLPRPPTAEPPTSVAPSSGAPPGPSKGPGEGVSPPVAASPQSTVPTR